jgi:hypothetical protein
MNSAAQSWPAAATLNVDLPSALVKSCMMQVSARYRNEYSLLLFSPPAGTSLRGTAKLWLLSCWAGDLTLSVGVLVRRSGGMECLLATLISKW